MAHVALLHCPETQQWLWFEEPIQVFVTHEVGEVLTLLGEVQGAIAPCTSDAPDAPARYAVGLLSYEAAPAFDPGLVVYPRDQGDTADFPLLWFGIYREPRRLSELPSELIASCYAPESPVAQGLETGIWTPTIAAGEFEAAIAQIKHAIAEGDTYQVNYTFRLRSLFVGDPWALFQALMRAQPGNYAAFLDLGRHVVCSASPELFFRRSGQTIVTKPMKGTIQRGLTPLWDQRQAQALHHDVKNRAENLMIVDMLRNDLGRIAQVGSVQVPALFTPERYPTLWQMTSTVTAESEATIAELFGALFPCASITGAPKQRTMEIIRELETTPRNLYTGTIGYFGPEQQAQFNVAIRTVVIDRATQQAEYGVGSGVVWDSQAQSEYQECCLKTEILTHQPPEFSLLETLFWSPETGYALWPYHRQRLLASADYFGFAVDGAAIEAQLAALAATFGPHPPTPSPRTGEGEPDLIPPLPPWERGLGGEGKPRAMRVRLVLGRQGEIKLEKGPAPIASPRFSLQGLTPSTDVPTCRVQLASEPVDPANVFLYHKTTARQVYTRARVACPEGDDVILWNDREEVTESCIANVVVQEGGVKGDRFLTPPLDCGLLAGTCRAQLLAAGEIEEARISVADLKRAKAVYLVNGLRGVQRALLM